MATSGPRDEFLAAAGRVATWTADYLEDAERYPVLSRLKPGELRSALPAAPPPGPEPLDQILDDFERLVLPGVTHWNHPAFFAYFANSSPAPAILAESLAAAVNANAMLWRTSPAATELEMVVLGWLRQMLGLPDDWFGVIQDTASASTLVALAAAREAVPGLQARTQGLAGSPPLRFYASEHAHSSVEKAGIVLGIGQRGFRRIPSDEQYRLRPDALAAAIAEDRAAGLVPFAVVATVGTTSTTSIDPVGAVADVCEREGLWLHVDAAYGGAAAVVPEMRWVLDGCRRADSLVVNPHKWLFVTLDLSAFYTRRPDVVRAAFSLLPDYLQTPERDAMPDLMDYGVSLGRRFRALKLWFVLRAWGTEGVVARLREHLRLTRVLLEHVSAEPGWDVMAPAPLSVVCFRARFDGCDDAEEDRRNEAVMAAVNRTGEAYLSHTRLHGRTVLRLAIGNDRTTERHVLRAWQLLREARAAVA